MSEQGGTILEPGKVIRPIIDHEGVKLLAERLYGISVLELVELNGYDDKNYKITEDPNMKNPLIPNHNPHGYVLKIMNSIDSQNLSVVEAQNEIMNFLLERSVSCPKPIRNIFGHLFSVENISGKNHVVRLLEYIPGSLLKEVPITESLLYQLGEFVANLDNKLQNFSHSGLVSREHIWMLSKVPELEKFKYVIKDSEKLDLVEEVYMITTGTDDLTCSLRHGGETDKDLIKHVIEEFKYAILPRLDELEKGVIHGDVNEMNVIVNVKPGEGKTEYRVSGILDFGDVQYSYYAFELAIAMTYMMLMTGDPHAGGIVLAGYSVNRRVPDEEYRLLKTLISARLVQSLILGAYTIEQDPKNTYVTSTEKANGWELLKKIRKTKRDPDDDSTNWKAIANEFLTRS